MTEQLDKLLPETKEEMLARTFELLAEALKLLTEIAVKETES